MSGYVTATGSVKVLFHLAKDINPASKAQADPGIPVPGVACSMPFLSQPSMIDFPYENDGTTFLNTPYSSIVTDTTDSTGTTGSHTVEIPYPGVLRNPLSATTEGDGYLTPNNVVTSNYAGIANVAWIGSGDSITGDPGYWAFNFDFAPFAIGGDYQLAAAAISGASGGATVNSYGISFATDSSETADFGYVPTNLAATNYAPYTREIYIPPIDGAAGYYTPQTIDHFDPAAASGWYTPGTTGATTVTSGVYPMYVVTFPNGQPLMPQLVFADGIRWGSPGETGNIPFQIDGFEAESGSSYMFDIQLVVHIVAAPNGKPSASDSTSTAIADQHWLLGATSIPEGGGNAKLYLVSSHARTTSTVHRYIKETRIGPDNLLAQYSIQTDTTNVTVSSDLRATVSTDFGQTFLPAVNVGIQSVDTYDLSDGNTDAYIVPNGLFVSPAGKMMVTAWIAGPANASMVAARICDDVLLRPPRASDGTQHSAAFRDAATATASMPGYRANGYLGIFQSAGSSGGSRGAGEQSSGVSALYAPGSPTSGWYISRDGGDTWETANAGYAASIGRLQVVKAWGVINTAGTGLLPAPAAFDTGNFFSASDVFTEPSGSGVTMLPNQYPVGQSGVLKQVGGFTGWSILYAFGTPGEGVGANTFMLPNSTDISQANLHAPAGFQNSGPQFAMFTQGPKIVIACAYNGMIRVFVSSDNGATATETVQSLDNMKTWRKAA